MNKSKEEMMEEIKNDLYILCKLVGLNQAIHADAILAKIRNMTTHSHPDKSKEEWEDEFDEKFVDKVKNINGGIAYEQIKYGEQTDVDEIRSFIRKTLTTHSQNREAGYKEIFAWLLGENGDFPDLSQKPHYSFRTELRKRLSALTPHHQELEDKQ